MITEYLRYIPVFGEGDMAAGQAAVEAFEDTNTLRRYLDNKTAALSKRVQLPSNGTIDAMDDLRARLEPDDKGKVDEKVVKCATHMTQLMELFDMKAESDEVTLESAFRSMLGPGDFNLNRAC